MFKNAEFHVTHADWSASRAPYMPRCYATPNHARYEQEAMPTFYTYMLECKAGKMPTFYTGYTNDLARRFSEHSSGRGARYTKGKELQLVFYQTFPTQKEAMNRELEIKGMPRKKKEALVQDVFVNEFIVDEIKNARFQVM